MLRLLGWAVLERARRKQCSRLSYLREDYIQRLRNEAGWATTHEDKQQLVYEHFATMMAPPDARNMDFNWSTLNLPQVNLDTLDAPTTEEEILQAIA